LKKLKTGEEIPKKAIREELSRILQSSIFSQSDRLGRFLRFTIESALSGKAGELKEYVIGTEVYDRKPSYHPSEDSIVRTEARRLRSKLKEYYEVEGKGDPVFIYYRPGSYVPVFRQGGTLADGRMKTANPHDLFVEGRGISLAVLPFVDVSHSALSAVCAQGITDELSHELMHTEGFRVTAASSVSQLVSQAFDIPSLAQKLGVQFVFEGTVREEKSQLRVTSRIVNADGFQIWSQRFETEPDPEGLFKVTEQLASSLISRTRPEQSAIRNRKASPGASVLAVYPAILSAEALLDEGTGPDTRAALTRFQEVARAEPRYARPFCGIALCYCEMAVRGVADSAAVVSHAKEAALRAAELDPQMISAPACVGYVLALQWDWSGAEKSFQEAVNLGAHAGTYRQYALFLAALGRFDQGWAYFQRAQQIDPFSNGQKIAHAKFFHLSRRYEEAVQHFTKRSVYGPLPVESQLYLALMLIALNRRDDAMRLADNAHGNSAGQPDTMCTIAGILATCGEAERAARIVSDFRLLSPGSPISKFRQALLCLALGDTGKALSLLSTAGRQREAEMIWLARDPRFDVIRENPQFASLLSTVMPPAPL
jgi:TolB-like protein/tetratricopeptide (TPR) repeat protein